MQFSNNKILEKVLNLKSIIIKTSIFTGLAAYWGIILVGTLITLAKLFKVLIYLFDGSFLTNSTSIY